MPSDFLTNILNKKMLTNFSVGFILEAKLILVRGVEVNSIPMFIPRSTFNFVQKFCFDCNYSVCIIGII